MSASRNKSKSSSSGLRFLWIPGRKRHNNKGHYDTTRKQIDYSGKQKNIEPWSLGGHKGQEKLIDSEIPGNSEGPSKVLSSLPATTIVAGASTAAMKLDESNRFSLLEDKNDTGMPNDSELLKSNEIIADKKTDHVDTLQISHKKDNNLMKSKDRIDSIESMQEKKLKDSSFDITDSSLYLSKYDNGKKKNKKKNKNKKRNDEDEDPDAKTVKCLYYTLMCCECTIS